MQRHDSAGFPRPDVVHASTATPLVQYSPSEPDFLIIRLFALRLAKRLIESLEPYYERSEDFCWIYNFLAPFPLDYDLAKITGNRKYQYMMVYPAIVGRMKRQPQYPLRFMEMNPATADRRDELHRQGGMTDAQRLEMINFSDAAKEWGSEVRLPAREIERMVALADQRRVAHDINYFDPPVSQRGRRVHEPGF